MRGLNEEQLQILTDIKNGKPSSVNSNWGVLKKTGFIEFEATDDGLVFDPPSLTQQGKDALEAPTIKLFKKYKSSLKVVLFFFLTAVATLLITSAYNNYSDSSETDKNTRKLIQILTGYEIRNVSLDYLEEELIKVPPYSIDNGIYYALCNWGIGLSDCSLGGAKNYETRKYLLDNLDLELFVSDQKVKGYSISKYNGEIKVNNLGIPPFPVDAIFLGKTNVFLFLTKGEFAGKGLDEPNNLMIRYHQMGSGGRSSDAIIWPFYTSWRYTEPNFMKLNFECEFDKDTGYIALEDVIIQAERVEDIKNFDGKCRVSRLTTLLEESNVFGITEGARFLTQGKAPLNTLRPKKSKQININE